MIVESGRVSSQTGASGRRNGCFADVFAVDACGSPNSTLRNASDGALTRDRIHSEIHRRNLFASQCSSGVLDSRPAGRTTKLTNVAGLDVTAPSRCLLNPPRSDKRPPLRRRRLTTRHDDKAPHHESQLSMRIASLHPFVEPRTVLTFARDSRAGCQHRCQFTRRSPSHDRQRRRRASRRRARAWRSGRAAIARRSSRTRFFQDLIEAQGLGFLPVGTVEEAREAICRSRPLASAQRIRSRRPARDRCRPWPRSTGTSSGMRARRTVVAASGIAFGARLAQERLGVPTGHRPSAAEHHPQPRRLGHGGQRADFGIAADVVQARVLSPGRLARHRSGAEATR